MRRLPSLRASTKHERMAVALGFSVGTRLPDAFDEVIAEAAKGAVYEGE